MNAEPHTHEITIRRFWESLDAGCWVVGYGDTRAKVRCGPFLERRLKRGVRRAIRRHDQGSIRAGQRAERMERIKAAAVAGIPKDGWASKT